jgi:hypothetical protein
VRGFGLCDGDEERLLTRSGVQGWRGHDQARGGGRLHVYPTRQEAVRATAQGRRRSLESTNGECPVVYCTVRRPRVS